MKRDHEFLMDLLNGFTGNRAFRRKLNIINEINISGWETWLQIEFSYYLNERTDVEWDRELRCMPDKRYATMKERCSIITDFVVRKKGWSLNYFLFIEFKQNTSPSACIRNMFSDLQKILSMKNGKECIARSYWCVGFTKISSDEQIEKIEKMILEHNGAYEDIEKYLTVKRIGQTPYCMIIF